MLYCRELAAWGVLLQRTILIVVVVCVNQGRLEEMMQTVGFAELRLVGDDLGRLIALGRT